MKNKNSVLAPLIEREAANLAEIAALEKLTAQTDKDFTEQAANANLSDPSAIASLSSTHILKVVLPARLASRQKALAADRETLRQACEEEISRIRVKRSELAKRARSKVREQLDPHFFNDEPRLIQAVEGSGVVRTIEFGFDVQPIRNVGDEELIQHAEQVMAIESKLDAFTKEHLS